MSIPDAAQALITSALEEDVGAGDWTTLWTVLPETTGRARIVAKAEGIIAGTTVAREVFRRIDPDLQVEILADDGTSVAPDAPVMEIRGSAASILTAERVALNFLQRLSGTATATSSYVAAVRGTGATILDTRKTTPGMRALEKAAVVAGGGRNHRFGLHDMVLIKENHIAAAGGIRAAVNRVREQNSTGLEVEVEVTTEEQIREAVAAGVDRILLDNMATAELRSAVRLARELDEEVELEASGGVTLQSVREIAECGVDFVSVGALTHSAPALDLSLLLEED